MKILIAVLVFCVMSIVCAQAPSDKKEGLPKEYESLVKKDTGHANFYCPRCGRRLYISMIARPEYEIKDAGVYTPIVVKYAGDCHPHTWQAVSGSEGGEQGGVTIYDCFWQFHIGLAEWLGSNKDAAAVLKILDQRDPQTCARFVRWSVRVDDRVALCAPDFLRYLYKEKPLPTGDQDRATLTKKHGKDLGLLEELPRIEKAMDDLIEMLRADNRFVESKRFQEWKASLPNDKDE